MHKVRRFSRNDGGDSGSSSPNAKPAYALAALFVLDYAVGTIIAHWGPVSAALTAAFAVFMVLGVAIWITAVVVDVRGLAVVQNWKYRRARRAIRRHAKKAGRDGDDLSWTAEVF